jgi:drug/metabolite transporter (DMT)-like permease
MESLFIVPVSVSTTVVVTYPIFTALADALVFKKPPKGIQIAGLLLGLLGVSLFTHPYVLGNYSVLGVFMALLGSVFAAGYFSIGKFVRRSTGVLAYAAVTYLSAAISVGTYALLTGENIINYPPRSFLYFVLLALVPMIGGHTVMNYVLRFLRTSSVTSIALGEPVGATILAYFIIKQLVDLPKIGAMALTIASIALIVSKEELPTES